MSDSATQFRNGREFVLDAPTTVPAVWGDGGEVLWSAGEPLILCGPQGVGKSSAEEQLLLARAGVAAPELLGYTVAPATRPILLLALDRPQQIRRSMRRMVTEEDAQALSDRLIVWDRPLPFNVTKQPEALAEWALEAGAGELHIDSLKDMMSPLSSDEVGSAYNRAIGGVIAAGVEVVVIHHQRKANSENRKPTSLADVYGSTWITSGAGSVILLWGQPGDPLVELTHLKQPAEQVGPLDLEHDHEHGHTTRRERPDTWTLLQSATAGGITAKDAAAVIYAAPTKADIEKVRRRLERFVEHGHAVVIPAKQANQPNVYRPTARKDSVNSREGQREGLTNRSRRSRNPENTAHATLTQPHAAIPLTIPLNKWGEREGGGDPTETDLDALIARHAESS